MKEKNNIYAVMVVGKYAPQKVYTNYEEAEEEAIRLCNKERMQTYVLKAITSVTLNNVTVTKLENN